MKTLSTRDGVILTLRFPDNVNFLEELLMLSMSLVNHTERGISLFHLFGVVFGTFQPLLACYGLFHFLQTTASQNVLTCKFTINQLHVDFITKGCVMKWDSLK